MRITPLVAVAALAACSHSSSGGASPAASGVAPRAVVRFDRVPDTEAAQVANPHEYKGGALCQRCHVAGEVEPSVDPIELCSRCHDAARMKHPSRVVQPSGAEGLPLMPGRLIACHTCHDPHDVKKNRAGLRTEYVALCLKCHRGHR